jgi:glycosyltransferase involved in cell wall biosynthesis/precorrin-6B methylase 2
MIPVYNERPVIQRSLLGVLEAPLPELMHRELIVVDDHSTDGTFEILRRFAAEHPEVKLFRHAVNRGKGAAIRTAIGEATGDFALIQDADLEYDPTDYPKLLRPLLDGHADAVFGSRYLSGPQRSVLPFWHSMINKFLTLASNMFSNLNLTDMETCYKVFRTDLLKSVPIRSDRFGFEPEIVMKSAKRKFRIYETPISYHGRTYEEGKKIGWKDGVKALFVILKFWMLDDLYAAPYSRGTVNNLTGTPQYVSWVASTLRPHLGDTVLEPGAGIGTMSSRLMAKRAAYTATESDPLYLHALRNRFLRTPNVNVLALDPYKPGACDLIEDEFDTVLALNLLEYASSPAAIIEALTKRVKPGGNLIVLAPQSRSLAGLLDSAMGHEQRFDRKELVSMLRENGFSIQRIVDFNKAGTPAWLLFSRILRKQRINKVFLKLFDKTVWLWRRFDGVIPWSGLSLIVIAKRQAHTSVGRRHASPVAVHAPGD